MKITNRNNLPEVFERYSQRNPYVMGEADYSVTTLIDSPRINHLRGAHRSDLTEDVSDQIMSLLGTAVHSILEAGAGPMDIVEKRMFAKVSDKVITGQIDLMRPLPDASGYILCDYKTTSGFSLLKEPLGKDSWHQQLNMYAEIARVNGFKVKGLEVVAVIRDWSLSGVKRHPKYPKAAVQVIDIPIWDQEKIIPYMNQRVEAHRAEDVPQCSSSERWERLGVYAVHTVATPGSAKAAAFGDGHISKRALRLFETRRDADKFVCDEEKKQKNMTKEFTIVQRPSTQIRCESYCSVSEYCEQWKEIKQNQGEKND